MRVNQNIPYQVSKKRRKMCNVTKKSRRPLEDDGKTVKNGRSPTLPHCIAVPSAQAGLTSLFGMGRGGAPLQ